MIAQFDSTKEATDAFRKIFQGRNWLLGLPNFAGTTVIAAFAFAAFVTTWFSIVANLFAAFAKVGPAAVPTISPAQVYFIVFAAIFFVLLTLVVGAYTYGWSLAAAVSTWSGEAPALGPGAKTALLKLWPLIAFTLIVTLLSIISLVTIVGPIVIAVLAMYGPCYIVFKNRSAVEALSDSCRLAAQNLTPTAIVALFLGGAYIVGLALTMMLGTFLGPLATTAFTWLFGAYSALAIVRFFNLLTPRAAPRAIARSEPATP
ncbi:MAG: hypothetical protein JOY86_07400 [Candidatus Eremiobacteraeota bacterium]|nr:hypothetical protein [Candidatus Eremiobacteraeota bacterium]